MGTTNYFLLLINHEIFKNVSQKLGKLTENLKNLQKLATCKWLASTSKNLQKRTSPAKWQHWNEPTISVVWCVGLLSGSVAPGKEYGQLVWWIFLAYWLISCNGGLNPALNIQHKRRPEVDSGSSPPCHTPTNERDCVKLKYWTTEISK